MDNETVFKLDRRFWNDLTEAFLNRENPERESRLTTELNLEQLSKSIENFIRDGLKGYEGGLTDYRLLEYYGGKIKQPKKGFSRQTLERLYNPMIKYSPPGVLIDLLCSYTYGLRYADSVSAGLVIDNLARYQSLNYKWDDVADGHISGETKGALAPGELNENHKNLSLDIQQKKAIDIGNDLEGMREENINSQNTDHVIFSVQIEKSSSGEDHFPKSEFKVFKLKIKRHFLYMTIGLSCLMTLIFLSPWVIRSAFTKDKQLVTNSNESLSIFDSVTNNSPFNKEGPPKGNDCPTISIRTSTNNFNANNQEYECDNSSIVSARKGDFINVRIYYHNYAWFPATNVRVQLLKYPFNQPSTKFFFQTQILCRQGKLISNLVEAQLDSESLVLFDHVIWTTPTDLSKNQISYGTEIMASSGLPIGNVDFNKNLNFGNLIVVFRVIPYLY